MIPPKICQTCGRAIEWRKKWERNWEQVRYCGERCRRGKGRADFKNEILHLLRERGGGKTICPSEVLPPELKQDKAMMERVRESARLLAAEGLIEITQNGRRVDPHDFRGPIRLRLR